MLVFEKMKRLPIAGRLFVFFTRRDRWGKLARGLLLIPVGYLLLANLLANARILPRLINTNPEKLEIRWAWAWSILPGVIHVHGYHLRVQDPNIQLTLDLPNASVGVDFFALFHREFHANWVRAEGVVYRMRFRPHSLEETEEHGKFAPPMPGLDFDPVDERGVPRKKGPPKPPGAKPDADDRKRERAEEEQRQENLETNPETEKLWRVRLEGVDAGVKEVWVEDYRWEGEGRATGGFFLRPKLTLEVLPTTIDLAKGQLHVGTTQVCSQLGLKVTGAIDKMNPEQHKGLDFFDFVVGQVAVDGTVEDLSFLNHYLREAQWVKIRGGGGPLHASVDFARGQFPGGVLDVKASALEASVLDDRASGAARVSWTVKPRKAEDEPVDSVLEVEFDRYELRRKDVEKPYVKGKGLALTARSRDLSIFDPGARLHVVILLPRAEVPDLSFYDRYVPATAGMAIDGGAGWIQSRLEYDTASDHGKGTLAIGGSGVQAHIEDLRMKGDLLLSTVIADARFKAKKIDIGGTTVALENVDLSGPSAPLRHKSDWWARAKIPSGQLAPGGKAYFDARIEAEVRDSAPIVSVFLAQQKPSAMVEAGLRSLLDIKNLTATTRVAVGPDQLDIDDLVVKGNGLEILGRLRVADKKKFAVTYLERGPFSAALRLHDEKVDVILLSPRAWYQKQPRND